MESIKYRITDLPIKKKRSKKRKVPAWIRNSKYKKHTNVSYPLIPRILPKCQSPNSRYVNVAYRKVESKTRIKGLIGRKMIQSHSQTRTKIDCTKEGENKSRRLFSKHPLKTKLPDSPILDLASSISLKALKNFPTPISLKTQRKSKIQNPSIPLKKDKNGQKDPLGPQKALKEAPLLSPSQNPFSIFYHTLNPSNPLLNPFCSHFEAQNSPKIPQFPSQKLIQLPSKSLYEAKKTEYSSTITPFPFTTMSFHTCKSSKSSRKPSKSYRYKHTQRSVRTGDLISAPSTHMVPSRKPFYSKTNSPTLKHHQLYRNI
ncbi:unnamed protein product [Moneuplotes crassus]|uniref:Uncharacterized protein n=1 Tax=Euplotes crassus TaxID=5936 RepID=A0AAD1UQZ7_EUPCR|nr:unnamed protein product [Moneuplotes crassus]